MKDFEFEEFDLNTTYQKLIAKSSPRTVKARDFFTLPDLITPLQHKFAQIFAEKSDTKR